MISIHHVVDFAKPERTERAFQYVKRTNQPAVQIAAGAQLDLGIALADRYRREMPNIKIFFRQLEDTGILTQITPEQLIEQRIKPRLQWFKDQRIIFMPDNETSGDDTLIKKYVANTVVVMRYLHQNGLNGAFLRFATGNIQETQYPLLKPVLDALVPGDWISPNEYSNAPFRPLGSGGNLERYKLIEKVAGKQLPIAIGEAGILLDYKANEGFQKAGISGKDAAVQLLSEEIWYRGGTIPRFVFCVGGTSEWDSLQLTDDFYTFLEGHYALHPIPTQTSTPPPVVVTPPPAPPPAPTPATDENTPINLAALRNIRSQLALYANTILSLSTQLATINHDVNRELSLIDALIDEGKKKK